jgi:hypothetical protein
LSALENSEKEKVEFTVFLNMILLPPFSLNGGNYWNFQIAGNFAHLERKENWFSINRRHRVFEKHSPLHHGPNYHYILTIHKEEEYEFVEIKTSK